MYLFVLQAAMDFLVEEKLKAHVSCWYIKKYIEDHPLQHYKELVITWLQPVVPVYSLEYYLKSTTTSCALLYSTTKAKWMM